MHEHFGQLGMTVDCAQSCTGGRKVSKTEPYDQYAEECRKLAARMQNPEDKKRLEELADAWAAVAEQRAKNKKSDLR